MSSWFGFIGTPSPSSDSALPTPAAHSSSDADLRTQAAANVLKTVSNSPSSLAPLQATPLSDSLDATTKKTEKVGQFFLSSAMCASIRELLDVFGDQGNVGEATNLDLTTCKNIEILNHFKDRLKAELTKLAGNCVPCSIDPPIIKEILSSDVIPDLSKSTLKDLSAVAVTARLLYSAKYPHEAPAQSASKALSIACQNELIRRLRETPDNLDITRILLTHFSEDDYFQKLVASVFKNMCEQTFLTFTANLAKNGISLRRLSVPSSIHDEALKQVIKSCPDLQYLDLSGCNELTEKVAVSIALNLQHLTHLSLRDFYKFKEIHFIDIIHKHKNLKHLDLSGQICLTDTVFETIYCFCQDITHLDLSRCSNLRNSAFENIAILKTLKHLNLNGCTYLSDRNFEAIAELTKLEYLDLGECTNLEGSTFKGIAKLTKLKHLNLSGCTTLKNSALQNIASLKTLEYLDLGGCTNLEDQAITSITNLRKLKYLDLSYCNKLADQHVNYIADNLQNLEFLNLCNCHLITDSAITTLLNRGIHVRHEKNLLAT